MYAVKLTYQDGNPDVEIYLKGGDRVVHDEKALPGGCPRIS